jgi:hypothetical protein
MGTAIAPVCTSRLTKRRRDDGVLPTPRVVDDESEPSPEDGRRSMFRLMVETPSSSVGGATAACDAGVVVSIETTSRHHIRQEA